MPLTKRQRDRIGIRFYDEQPQYERLAQEIRRLIDEESVFLADAIYTVKHRLKDKDRLLQKIEQQNDKPGRRTKPIDDSNFQDRVDDLLGIRIVCLRLSDLQRVKDYLAGLEQDLKIKVTKGPIEKKTFLVTPGDAGSAEDMQYSGYSSIHYVIQLGKTSRNSAQLSNLRAELQLRTILEEAWGEIDHKYRYELKRAGAAIPAHIDSGFRDLALYLQAAARHVEHLCEEIHRNRPKPKKARRRSPPKRANIAPSVVPSPTAAAAKALPPSDPLQSVLKRVLGFDPGSRATPYVRQRLIEHSDYTGREFGVNELEAALDEPVRRRFAEIYEEVMNKEPFAWLSDDERVLDIIPLVNFAIFSTKQSRELAEAGLRASLRRRFEKQGR